MNYELYEILFPNGKRYIGISVNYKLRFDDHIKHTRKAYSKSALYSAMRKYGTETLKLRLLVVGDKEYITNLEILAIAQYNTTDRRFGYNMSFGGTISPMYSPEVAAKVSASKKGVYTEAMRKALRSAPRATSETLSNAHKKRWATLTLEEQRKFTWSQKGKPSLKKGIKITDPVVLARIQKSVDERGDAWYNKVVQSNKDENKRARISATLMGHSGAGKGTKRPEIGAWISELIWITNDKERRRIHSSLPIPAGWRRGKNFKHQG